MSDLFGHQAKTLGCTSVSDATLSVRKSTSLTDLNDWLCSERAGMNRRSLINAITARIRQLGKEVTA